MSFELSSGVLSTVAVGTDNVGVEVPDLSTEAAREEAVEDIEAEWYKVEV